MFSEESGLRRRVYAIAAERIERARGRIQLSTTLGVRGRLIDGLTLRCLARGLRGIADLALKIGLQGVDGGQRRRVDGHGILKTAGCVR